MHDHDIVTHSRHYNQEIIPSRHKQVKITFIREALFITKKYIALPFNYISDKRIESGQIRDAEQVFINHKSRKRSAKIDI